MIGSIEFRNFKVLRDTTLPLAAYTLVIGPNGSGKSTVWSAIELVQRLAGGGTAPVSDVASLGVPAGPVSVQLAGDGPFSGGRLGVTSANRDVLTGSRAGANGQGSPQTEFVAWLSRARQFNLSARAAAMARPVQPTARFQPDGTGLPIVLDRLRDEAPERFAALEAELPDWFPEFDRVLFSVPDTGQKSIGLRMREGQAPIPAHALSEGTILGLCFLALSHMPDPPSLVFVEEPERGVHPRLLRLVHEALLRLAEPASFGRTQAPVQVIATTHSPYFLDLFRERPELVVIAERTATEARFVRLLDLPGVRETIDDGAALGEIWFTGLLGGVPAGA